MRPVIAIIRSPALTKLPDTFLLAHQLAITASIYLDDLLVLISSSQDGVAIIEAVVDLYKLLGLKVKESKSILQPQVQLEHLGFLLDCS